MMNNYSFMARRDTSKNELDFFPTPPFGTRALLEQLFTEYQSGQFCLEPAAGMADMTNVLKEWFSVVDSYDIVDRGMGFGVRDFLTYSWKENSYDWVITNPPFNKAEEFIIQGLKVARKGVAVLSRTQLVEGQKRYNNIYSKYPPSTIYTFVERLPMFKNRLNRKGSTATSYSWFVWKKPLIYTTELHWIPPCRKRLERDTDYEAR